VNEEWGKHTDNDRAAIDRRRDQLEGRIHDLYGQDESQIRKEVDEWLRMV
jgi:uncharacterized protein YjbJ (UPF0337 family)